MSEAEFDRLWRGDFQPGDWLQSVETYWVFGVLQTTGDVGRGPHKYTAYLVQHPHHGQMLIPCGEARAMGISGAQAR